ncbi:MAG: diversity-generating retroelement protein Avd [Patescibacteria group bacterium]|nr:diversity-generating retroelement protein Avd [Patescibacteria group bacterium]
MDTPLILKTYELYKLFYEYLALFPKKDKYTLGAKCELYILATMESLIAASNSSKDKKLALIQQANLKFDTLKILIRLAKDVKALDTKKYIALQERIHEIGKMLGGWQRSLN